MAIKVVELMHAGVRVPPDEGSVAAALDVYRDLLGLEVDTNRPHIADIPGFWVNIAAGERRQQVHVMGAEGKSPPARSAKQDPTRPHMAFAVADLDGAKAELTSRDIEFWIYESLVGRGSEQVFFEDGLGNMIELQQHRT